MDDALVHGTLVGAYYLVHKVLILVLMDDALVPKYPSTNISKGSSLNPCFNG